MNFILVVMKVNIVGKKDGEGREWGVVSAFEEDIVQPLLSLYTRDKIYWVTRHFFFTRNNNLLVIVFCLYISLQLSIFVCNYCIHF